MASFALQEIPETAEFSSVHFHFAHLRHEFGEYAIEGAANAGLLGGISVHSNARGEDYTVLIVNRAMAEGGDQQLIPARSKQQRLVLQWQRRKVRDVLNPLHQLLDLLTRWIINVVY